MAADAVLTTYFREQIAAHMAGKSTLAPIKYMAFGDGGHDLVTLEPLAPSEGQNALKHEVLRKTLNVITQEDSLSVTGKCTIASNEIVGVHLSEAALVDANGKLIGIKNFAPKVKEGDEQYTIHVKVRF